MTGVQQKVPPEVKLEHAAAYMRLERLRPRQRRSFEALKTRFEPAFRKMEPYLSREEPWACGWPETWRQIAARLLPEPPFSFLSDVAIRNGMTASLNEEEVPAFLQWLRGELPEERLAELLLADLVGQPPGLVLSPLSTKDQVHKLHTFLRFLKATGCEAKTLRTIVEWGGGYGCQAKVIRRFLAAPVTYVIIDSAIMSLVQWLYLATIFGEESVHLIDEEGGAVREGRFNLLPLCFLRLPLAPKADLFISTFALTESSELAQSRIVADSAWLGARRLLLAYHRHAPFLSDPAPCFLDYVDSGAARVEKSVEYSNYAFR